MNQEESSVANTDACAKAHDAYMQAREAFHKAAAARNACATACASACILGAACEKDCYGVLEKTVEAYDKAYVAYSAAVRANPSAQPDISVAA